MKMYKAALMNALLAIAAYAATPAEATETLNLSYAHAAITWGNNCRPVTGLGWQDAFNNPNDCEVSFALPVTSGHLVKQISVLHSSYCPNNDPYCWTPNYKVSAYVLRTTVAGGNNGIGDSLFYWSTSTWVSFDTTATSPLMNNKFDAFTTAPDTMYTVIVSAHDFATIQGIQVVYE